MSEASERSRSVFRDTRIDRVISWVLAFAATMAMALGGWFFSDLRSQIEKLGEKIDQVNQTVVLLPYVQRDVADHETRIRELERVRMNQRASN